MIFTIMIFMFYMKYMNGFFMIYMIFTIMILTICMKYMNGFFMIYMIFTIMIFMSFASRTARRIRPLRIHSPRPGSESKKSHGTQGPQTGPLTARTAGPSGPA